MKKLQEQVADAVQHYKNMEDAHERTKKERKTRARAVGL